MSFLVTHKMVSKKYRRDGDKINCTSNYAKKKYIPLILTFEQVIKMYDSLFHLIFAERGYFNENGQQVLNSHLLKNMKRT